MAGRYDPSQRFKGVDPSRFRPRAPTQQDKDKEGQADFMRFLGDIAPTAGGVIGAGVGGLAAGLSTGGMGAPAGAALGGTIGGGLGQMAGTALHGGAESMVGDRETEEITKQQERDAMLATLMGLRR